MTTVAVIGIDGRPLAADAARRLAAADLVVGGARHLDLAQVPGHADTVVLGDVAAAADTIAAHRGRTVILASGDPGFFGILRLLQQRKLDVEVFPAVSSVSALFARVGMRWDDALVVSAHGRDPRRALNSCRAHRKVAVFTSPQTTPGEIAAAVARLPRRLVVGECLGTPDERVIECTPAQAADRSFAEPNVVLVLGNGSGDGNCDGATSTLGESAPTSVFPARQTPRVWALPDESFEHRGGMVTKFEVRATALAQLAPGVGDLVWDIGSGSGSVAVECARFGAAVVAVDRDPEQCARIRRNATGHDVDIDVVIGEAPHCLAELPPADAAYVGGGGVDVVTAVASRVLRSVVATLAAVDRVGPTRAALRAAGFDVDGICLHSSRLCELPDGSSRLASTNPVFVLWARR